MELGFKKPMDQSKYGIRIRQIIANINGLPFFFPHTRLMCIPIDDLNIWSDMVAYEDSSNLSIEIESI